MICQHKSNEKMMNKGVADNKMTLAVNAEEILTSFSFVLSQWVLSHSFWRPVHGGGAVGELDQLVNENVVAHTGWDCWCEEILGTQSIIPQRK